MPPASSALSIERGRYGIREIAEDKAQIIPELRLIGHVSYHTARPFLLRKHRHADVLEIFYIVEGKVSWWVKGVSHEVCGNQVFVVQPGEWHGATNDIVEPAEYYWIHVHLPSLRKNRGGALLEKELRSISTRQFIGRSELAPLYHSLLNEHAYPVARADSVVRETLHLLLAWVARCSRTGSGRTQSQPSPVARAMQWAKSHLPDATLRGMIQASGMKPLAFRKHFCATVGISPVHYLIRLRLENAKTLLKQGRSITAVSHQLGFNSSQYFATVFRKYEGISPSVFAAQRNANKRETRGG
jgi:AraC-like DNA-binding protein/mannose-6-phosphate isomerase-like protein (cupin superfamily)